VNHLKLGCCVAQPRVDVVRITVKPRSRRCPGLVAMCA
jgi:hypothetical protein